MEINVDVTQMVVAIASSIVAASSFAIAIASLVKMEEINYRQIKREENTYLLSVIIKPYCLLETDAMLLSQGVVDTNFQKDIIDREVLLAINYGKGYALTMHNNDNLFNYLDGLITGKSEEDIGALIDRYFEVRNEKVKIGPNDQPSINKVDGEIIRDEFLGTIRKYRNGAINKIKYYLTANTKHKSMQN